MSAGKLSHNGKRYITRGWTGAKYVKRQTSRKARRNVREAIRANDGEVLKANTKGWAW